MAASTPGSSEAEPSGTAAAEAEQALGSRDENRIIAGMIKASCSLYQYALAKSIFFITPAFALGLRSKSFPPINDHRQLQSCDVCNAGLTDEQLLEVFKQTSIFNVRSALAGNDSLMGDADPEAGLDRY